MSAQTNTGTTPETVVNGSVTLEVPLMQGGTDFVKVLVATPRMLLEYTKLLKEQRGDDFLAMAELFTGGKPGSANRYTVEGVFAIIEKGEELMAGPFAVMLAAQKRRLARTEALFANQTS